MYFTIPFDSQLSSICFLVRSTILTAYSFSTIVLPYLIPTLPTSGASYQRTLDQTPSPRYLPVTDLDTARSHSPSSDTLHYLRLERFGARLQTGLDPGVLASPAPLPYLQFRGTLLSAHHHLSHPASRIPHLARAHTYRKEKGPFSCLSNLL